MLIFDGMLSRAAAGVTAAFITDSFDPDVGSGVRNPANYMRGATTSYCYTWDGTGQLLTQVAATGTPATCP